MMELRPYQSACLNAIFSYWKSGNRRGVCVVPTGAGKSAIIAGLVKTIIEQCPETRILVITDNREIISQNRNELLKYWPEANTGIYSSGLGEKNTTAQIVFAGVQSIYKSVLNQYPAFDLCISDESHMISRDSETRYGELFKNLALMNPNYELVGFTATNYRMSEGYLHEGQGALFNGVIYEIKIPELIKSGYLVPVISIGGVSQIDLSNVQIRGNEYVQESLAFAADDPILIQKAVDEIIKYGSDRKSWLVFATSIQHAINISNEIKSHGISCEPIYGSMPKNERDLILSKFKSGELQAVVNVHILIKGFNNPRLDLIALMTSTRSTAKYIQAVGRILRPFPGKVNGLLLDFGGNVELHSVIDNANPIFKRGSAIPQPAPVKTCPECRLIIHASTRNCPKCGYTYPEQETLPNHGTQAFDGAVLTDQIEPFWVTVRAVEYSRHQKEGKPDSVKVSYLTQGGERYNNWLCVEHSGFAAQQALRWLSKIGSDATSVSEALEEAMSGRWPFPRRIQCKQDGKWCRVVNEDYSKATQECLKYE